MLPEQQQRIMGYFIEEAKDHLNTIEQGLLNLQGPLRQRRRGNAGFDQHPANSPQTRR